MLIGSRPLTKSRLVLLAATVVVVLGMLAGLGALVLDPARAAVGPLPAAALVLPADARFVMGFDVKRFTASPFYTRYASRPGMRPQAFGELEQKTGLDAARDLDQIVVSGTGLGADDARHARPGDRALRRRTSSPARSRPRARRARYRHEGATVWAFKEDAARRVTALTSLGATRSCCSAAQAQVEAAVCQPQARRTRRCARTS